MEPVPLAVEAWCPLPPSRCGPRFSPSSGSDPTCHNEDFTCHQDQRFRGPELRPAQTNKCMIFKSLWISGPFFFYLSNREWHDFAEKITVGVDWIERRNLSPLTTASIVAQTVESALSTGILGSIPGSGRSPGGGKGYPLQYSCMENSMDRGAWWAPVHGSQRVGHD